MDRYHLIKSYVDKFTLVLDELKNPTFHLHDSLLESLIQQLSTKLDKEITVAIVNDHSVTAWLETIVSACERSITNGTNATSSCVYPQQTQRFALELSALLMQNELMFVKFDLFNFHTRMSAFVSFETNVPLPMKSSYIKLLSAYLQHSSGRKWLVHTQQWRVIYNDCFKANTMYKNDDNYRFIAQFMRLNDSDWIVADLTRRLSDGRLTVLNLTSKILANDPGVWFESFRNVDFLPAVLALLDDCDKNAFPALHTTIVLYFYQQYNADSNAVFKAIYETYYRRLLDKDNLYEFLNAVHFSYVLWPHDAGHAKYNFSDQIFLFQVLPLGTLSARQHVDNQIARVFLDEFNQKLVTISGDCTTRLSYVFRDKFLNRADCARLVTTSINNVMKSRARLTHAHAVIYFQSAVYLLKNIVVKCTEDAREIARFNDAAGVLSTLLASFMIILREFRISWRDSVETICIVNLLFEALRFDLCVKLTVQTLNVVNIAIVNFMPASLALLVEANTSGIKCIAPIILEKMRNVNWEIRDSALEILTTMAAISDKYPPFIDLIVENHLSDAAISCIANDTECYVRASAIKAICAMIKTTEYWTNCLDKMGIYDITMKSLTSEPEGMVRAQAALLLAELLEHNRIPTRAKPVAHAQMTRVTLNDLHWEVKLNALTYWRHAIAMELTDHGMVDGEFPSVTFSKESKKIIQLNAEEIRARLTKTLRHLKEMGCLRVLVQSLRDEDSVQIIDKTREILEWFGQVLEMHGMLKDVPNVAFNGCELERELETNADCSVAEFLGVLREGHLDASRGFSNVRTDEFNSLLDDILKRYNGDVNSLDCY